MTETERELDLQLGAANAEIRRLNALLARVLDVLEASIDDVSDAALAVKIRYYGSSAKIPIMKAYETQVLLHRQVIEEVRMAITEQGETK